MTTIQEIDCLSLLSLKVAPRVFDISSDLHHISIRDQIVRARILVRDLIRADENIKSILIIGCGAAGVSAALSAIGFGIKKVIAIDSADHPFSLLSSVKTRYVGPYMYEWPSIMFDNQSYPNHANTPWPAASRSTVMKWESKEPCSAEDLANLLKKNLNKHMQSSRTPKPDFLFSVNRNAILSALRNFIKKGSKPITLNFSGLPLPSHSTGNNNQIIKPDYIIIAAGIGSENCDLLAEKNPDNFTGKPFWKNDDLLNYKYADQNTLIVGGGDGAMQDALRILTGLPHPLKFLKKLEKFKDIKPLIAKAGERLLAADRQCRHYQTWSIDKQGYALLDKECERIAKEMSKYYHVRKSILKLIRKGNGTVHLFIREPYFGKAYLLNRFLVYLIHACRRNHTIKGGNAHMKFNMKFNHTATGFTKCNGAPKIPNHQVTITDTKNQTTQTLTNINHIVVRYGIKKGSVPGRQLIQVTNRSSKQRTTLSRVELPFFTGY